MDIGRSVQGDQQMFNLELEVVFTPINISTEEISPKLYVWSTTSPILKSTTYEESQGHFDNTIPRKIDLPINIGNKSVLRQDDALHFECRVLCENQDGKMVGVRAGTAGIYLYPILQALKSSPKNAGPFETKADLRLPTFTENGVPYTKASVQVKIMNTEELLRKNIRFEDTDEFSYVSSNSEFINNVVFSRAGLRLYPFTEDGKKESNISPSDPSMNGLHAPLWINNVYLPVIFYWLYNLCSETSEEFLKNLANIALDRNKISRETFIKTVEAQFNIDPDEDSYDPLFSKMCGLTLEACCILPTALRYISDITYTKGVTGSYTRAMIESFNSDPYLLGGGDCEDLHVILQNVATFMEVGAKENATGDGYAAHGSWKDPVLKNMQRILHIYCVTGQLGTVTSKFLGENEKNKTVASTPSYIVDDGTSIPKIKMPEPIIIGSDEDKNVEIGGHMWVEGIPIVKMEDFIEETMEKGTKFRTYPNEKRYAWGYRCPWLTGEGTGYMDTQMRVSSDYYFDDPLLDKKIKDDTAMKFAAYTFVSDNTVHISKGYTKRFQSRSVDVPDMRLSRFYRDSTEFATNKFVRAGYRFGQFIWKRYGIRQPETATGEVEGRRERKKKEIDRDADILWGVDFRDRLTCKSEIGVFVVPGINETEYKVAKSLLRHIRPTTQFTRNPSEFKSMKSNQEIADLIEKLNKRLEGINSSRKSEDSAAITDDVMSPTSTDIFYLYRREDFMEVHEWIHKDVEIHYEITHAKAILEIIYEDLINVRLEMKVNMKLLSKAMKDDSFVSTKQEEE